MSGLIKSNESCCLVTVGLEIAYCFIVRVTSMSTSQTACSRSAFCLRVCYLGRQAMGRSQESEDVCGYGGQVGLRCQASLVSYQLTLNVSRRRVEIRASVSDNKCTQRLREC